MLGFRPVLLRRLGDTARSQAALASAIEGLEVRRLLAVITVTTVADDLVPNDGSVSLREAITAINAGNDLGDPDIAGQNPGAFGAGDAVHFNIPGAGVHTIKPAAGLTEITKPMVIDGTTQPGFDVGSHNPVIELDGELAGAAANGLRITGGGSTVLGIAINRFGANGIDLLTKGGNTVSGNYIGTDVTGTAALPNHETGVLIEMLSSANTIGGTDAGARNIISGNGEHGVVILGGGNSVQQPDQNVVEGNYIGTDVTGMVALGNRFDGVSISSQASSNIVGGTTVAARNVISGNGSDGIGINGPPFGQPAQANLIEGNYIGTDATGAGPLGNHGSGVFFDFGATDNLVGGTVPAAGNVIAFNTGAGVTVLDFTGGGEANGNAIRLNAIYSNGGLAIDLSPIPDFTPGTTPNDPGDTDTGPNGLQNFPVLASADNTGGVTTVHGLLNSKPNTDFLIDFYSSPAVEASGAAQARHLSDHGARQDGRQRRCAVRADPAVPPGRRRLPHGDRHHPGERPVRRHVRILGAGAGHGHAHSDANTHAYADANPDAHSDADPHSYPVALGQRREQGGGQQRDDRVHVHGDAQPTQRLDGEGAVQHAERHRGQRRGLRRQGRHADVHAGPDEQVRDRPGQRRHEGRGRRAVQSEPVQRHRWRDHRQGHRRRHDPQ